MDVVSLANNAAPMCARFALSTSSQPSRKKSIRAGAAAAAAAERRKHV